MMMVMLVLVVMMVTTLCPQEVVISGDFPSPARDDFPRWSLPEETSHGEHGMATAASALSR